MQPSTQKLIHTFGALADLGQEIAGTGEFAEMVRTSLHLLLGTLALRRGAVAECIDQGSLRCVAVWGLGEEMLREWTITEAERRELLDAQAPEGLVKYSEKTFIGRNHKG